MLHNVYVYIYIYIYLCIAYISSHSKGPEQDQLRSPFVPYVRNTAERSIHNFDSGPYIYIYMCKMLNLQSKEWPCQVSHFAYPYQAGGAMTWII